MIKQYRSRQGRWKSYLTLHGRLERAIGADLVEPLRVHRASGASEGEGQARASVILVQDSDLVGELRIAAEDDI